MKKYLIILFCLMLCGCKEPVLEPYELNTDREGTKDIVFGTDSSVYLGPSYKCPTHGETAMPFFVCVEDEETIFCAECLLEFLKANIPEVEEIKK